jgi:four helix bundle protein
MLGYEKFGAYQKALEFYAFAIKIVDKFAASKGGINDQFLRAALSIVLNIAEAML